MDKHNRKKKTVDDTVCEIHKFSGYAVLSNCFVRSTNLSWSAIGLLARVMDFPHEWNFSKAGLIAICPDGETAIDTALSELKEWGYLEIKTLMPNESSTGRIQPLYSFYEYSARDTSIPQYDYELETFMVENAVLNRVKKTDNYTMISSKLLRNKEIPNKLLGFLLKVLSLPDYWHFSMSGLKAICKEGKTAVHNAVNKLIDMGYLVRTQLLSNESIHGDYCCAMGVWYGYCNDRFLIELENGTQFTTKICDSKGYADDGEGKYHNFGGSGKCIVEFIYDDGNLPSCVAFSGSWGYYNWNGLDLGANIKSIKKINYGEPVDY